jgi:hypothetical protein
MTAVEKLIAKYNKQWNKYGMGSVVAYSKVVADLEKLKEMEKEQCKCGKPRVGGYSCQRTDCNQTFKQQEQ